MTAIVQEKAKLPLTIKIGEGLNNLHEFVDVVVEELLAEAAEQTLEGDINEIHLAYLLNGSTYDNIFSHGGDAKATLTQREDELEAMFPKNYEKRLDAQKGRAQAMYDLLNQGGYTNNVARVAWTARKGSLGEFIYGADSPTPEPGKTVDQRLNPSDVVVQYKKPSKLAGGGYFLGISAKSTKQKKADIAWANRGIGSLLDPVGGITTKQMKAGIRLDLKQTILGIPGQKSYYAIEKKREELRTAVLNTVNAHLAKHPGKYAEALSMMLGKEIQKKGKGTGEYRSLSAQALKLFVKRLEKTINPIDDPNDEGYDPSLKGISPFSATGMGNLAPILLKNLKTAGGQLLEYARDQVLDTYTNMALDDFKEHFLYFWVRQEGDALTPPWIQVTGRGKKTPYSATISKATKKAQDINNETQGFTFSPVGRDAIGISDSEGTKLAKIRMKYASRVFSSIKPTGEPW